MVRLNSKTLAMPEDFGLSSHGGHLTFCYLPSYLDEFFQAVYDLDLKIKKALVSMQTLTLLVIEAA